MLAQALIFSKGYYNAGTWSGVTSSQLGKMHAAMMYVYHVVAGQRSDGTSHVDTDDKVIHDLSVIAPAVMIEMARMSLFVRVCFRRPMDLMRLLEVSGVHKSSWLRDVQADFAWAAGVAEVCKCWQGLPMRTMVQHAGTDAPKLKTMIGQVCCLPEANVCRSWARTATQRQLGEAWSCPECGRSFKTKQALATHRRRKHGVKRITRQYVDTTHCVACLLEFHDRERLINHLEEKSPPCCAAVLERLPQLAPEIVEELDARAAMRVRELAASGKRRVHASLPCVRLQGPLLPINVVQEHWGRHPLGPNRRWLA